MAYKTRNEFIKAASSEKITLAKVNAKARLYTFNAPVGNVYSKQVPYFVFSAKQNDTTLFQVSDIGSIGPGTFYYDIKTSTLYTWLIGGVSPKTVEFIATYTFFYADKGLSLPHDLQDASEDVFWDGRIVSSPGYKHKIGIDQALTSLVGEGTLQLKNQDGGFDDTFDALIFENQDVTIYSWSPDLKPSDARVIYRGKITNKTFDDVDVKFKIKDQIFSLLDSPPLEQYTVSDNVSDSAQGRFKRLVYGRVDGLRCQSIDQVGAGYELNGTITMTPVSALVTGQGTQFLTEVKQGDKFIVGTQEFTVDKVNNDGLLTLSDEPDYAAFTAKARVVPENGNRIKNRQFIAAGHTCAQVETVVVNVPQFNRVKVLETGGLFAGDFIEFVETGERIEIKTVAPDNIIVLQQNMILKPTVGTAVIRRPIQEVYIGSRRVSAQDFTINNTATNCGLTFSEEAELNLAFAKNTAFTGSFVNGSRVVSFTPGDVALDEVFSPGDWIKPDGLTYTTFYQIVNVNEFTIDLATNFADPSISDIVELKSPEYIQDDTVISVNILGKTENGAASGLWISKAAQVQRDLIKSIGITQFNTQSFTEGAIDSKELISLAIPNDFDTKTPPTVKEIVDQVSKSTNSSLTLDNDLLIKFKTLNVFTEESLPVISDFDLIDWKMKATNGKTYKRVFSRYRFTDVDLATLEDGNKSLVFDSEFVNRYIETNKVNELDLYLYEEVDAQIATHRNSYYNRLGVTTVTVTTDLRLENVEIGEVVILDLKRLYKRFGNNAHRKKVMLVIGKTLTGERTELILSDLGNTFNTSSYITPNDAPEWVAATDDQKLIYGYITDNQGIVNNEEDTAGTHLIS